MTARRISRWRGDGELLLDGSRLGFELWYRFLLLARDEGEAIDYRLYADWSLLNDVRTQGRLIQRGFERTLENFNPSQWSYRMFGTSRKKSEKWQRVHSTFDEKAPDPVLRAPDKPGGRPDSRAIQKEIGGAVKEALGKLKEVHRMTFVLREIEGLSCAEVAAVMKCMQGTVMSRLFYARMKLQDYLRPLMGEARS